MDFREELKKIWDKWDRYVPIFDQEQNDQFEKEVADLIKSRLTEAFCYPSPSVRRWAKELTETGELHADFLREPLPK